MSSGFLGGMSILISLWKRVVGGLVSALVTSTLELAEKLSRMC